MDKGIIFLGVGFELVALVMGGYFLGQYIDEYFGWKTTGTTTLIILLMVGWFVHLFYLLQRFEKEAESDDPTPKP